MTIYHADDPEPGDPQPQEEAMIYVCDNCGREVDEAEAYIDEGVLCPDCYLDSLEAGEK
jgi:formylmethanofuran dehydrogenase subunit E